MNLLLLLFVISFTGIAVPSGTIFKDRECTTFVFPSNQSWYSTCVSQLHSKQFLQPSSLFSSLNPDLDLVEATHVSLPLDNQQKSLMDVSCFSKACLKVQFEILWEWRWVQTIKLHYSMMYELTFQYFVRLTFEPGWSMHADNMKTIYVAFCHW